MIYDPVCEVCHMRPKMDRCDCCEECWYSGRYSRARAAANRPRRRKGIDWGAEWQRQAATKGYPR